MDISSPQNLKLAASELFKTISEGYRPPPFYSYNLPFLPGVPPFNSAVVDGMRHDYQVKLAIAMKTVPVMKPQFTLSGDPEVVQFVERTIRKIWTNHITDITDAMWYTRFGAEVCYKQNEMGQVEFDRMLPFHPRDIRILTNDRKPVGFRVVASWGSWTIEGVNQYHLASMQNSSSAGYHLMAPKSFIYVHGQKFGSFEGTSELEGAYEPWLEKVREGGAIASRSLWFYKNAFDSGMLVHPPGVWTDPTNGQQVPYRDIAMQMGQKLINGGVITVEALYDERGNLLWQFIKPQINQGGDVLLQYIDHLDHKIILGTGIPDDVIQQNSGTGSYAGRTIPFIAFLESGTPTVRAIASAICENVVRPLTVMNFGENRGRDWELIEAKVNVDQFLGGEEADMATGKKMAGDGDGDGIPHEAAVKSNEAATNRAEGIKPQSQQTQFSQQELEEQISNKPNSLGKINGLLHRISPWIGAPASCRFIYAGRKPASCVSFAHLHQFSHSSEDQARGEDGRWIQGFAANHPKHSVTLPRDRSQVQMKSIIKALEKSGYSVGSEETHHKTGEKFRYITSIENGLERMSDEKLTSLAYSLASRLSGEVPEVAEKLEEMDPEITKDQLAEVMERIEPSAIRGALVGFKDLRKEFPSHSKRQFDNAVLNLAKDGMLNLHRHDYPAALDQESLDQLVSHEAVDGESFGYKGRVYYVGAAMKKSK